MLFAVFDGHLGEEVAIYVKAEFERVLLEQESYKAKDYQKALHDTFMLFDTMIDERKVELLRKINFPG